jgi:hypothetical protein
LPRLLVIPAVVSITRSGIDLTVIIPGEVGALVAFVASVVVVVVLEIVEVSAVVETAVKVGGVVVGADVVDEEVVTAGVESITFDIWDPSVSLKESMRSKSQSSHRSKIQYVAST